MNFQKKWGCCIQCPVPAARRPRDFLMPLADGGPVGEFPSGGETQFALHSGAKEACGSLGLSQNEVL
jgi:hypothetical protein